MFTYWYSCPRTQLIFLSRGIHAEHVSVEGFQLSKSRALMRWELRAC